MTIEAGRVLNERYRLVRPVGQGAQASVWIAEHLALGSQVAVKLIDPELAKKQDALDRFRREATAAAQLRSAHVVQILDHGVDDAQPYIVMELLDGHDLFERIESRGRLSLKETSKIVTQVARALTRAHAAGIVHRDLKPENVFLVPNEDDEIAKVLDFGVAKIADPAKHTMQRTGVGTLLGTPHYMSPEQVKGVTEVDFRTDLWALGIMAYQCVTGELPFDSEGVGDLLIKITIGDAPVPSKVLPSLPATFDAWFAKACNRDPDKRFESARDMADALARAVGVATAESGPASIPRPSRASLPGEQAPKPGAAKPQPAAAVAPEASPTAALEESTDVDEIAVVESLSIRPPLDSTDVSFEESESSDPIAGTPRPSKRPPPRQVPPVQVGGRDAAASPVAPAAGASAHANGSVALPPPPRLPGARPPAAAVSSTVSGLASSGMLSMPPPPELDGSRHRRTKRLLAFAFLAGAGVVAWFAAKPYLTPPRPVAPEPTVAAAPPPPIEDVPSTRPVALEPDAASASSAAVDPGRRVAPGAAAAATATAAPKPGAKGRPKKATNDGTVEIPDPEREVPAKPTQPQGPPPEPEDPGPPPGD